MHASDADGSVPPPGQRTPSIKRLRGWLRRDRSARAFDEMRGVLVVTNQLLLTGIVFVVVVVGLALGSFDHVGFVVAGAAAVVIAALAAFAVPWQDIPRAWVGSIPLVDIIAVDLLRAAAPQNGLGVLWVLPLMWLGVLGAMWLLTGCLLVTVGYVGMVVAARPSFPDLLLVLLPIVLFAVGVSAYLSSRRFGAQRTVLEQQTVRLGAVMQRAARQEKLLSDVLDTVHFGIVRLDRTGEVIFVNEAMGELRERIPGFGGADLDVEMFAADAVTPLAPTERPLARLVRGDRDVDEVVWVSVSATRKAAVHILVRAAVDARGEADGAVLIVREVTAEMTARKVREDLVAAVSHELRTPLTSMLGYVELARDVEALPAEAARHLDVVDRNGARLLEIVSGILAASSESRMSAAITIAPAQIDLADVLRAAASDFAAIAARNALAIDVSGVTHAPAFADTVRVRRVVDSLLGRAVAVTRVGGTVRLTSASDGDLTWFSVVDEGAALSDDEMGHLFDPFAPTASAGPHTGLSLAISREIIRAHGGDLDVVTGVGGTAFDAHLAAHAADEPSRTEEG